MHPLRGPLLVIAAAIIWVGSVIVHAGAKYRSHDVSMAGVVAAVAILAMGLYFTPGKNSDS